MFETNYIIIFLINASVAVVFTLLIKRLAWKWKIIDQPKGWRKIHSRATPLLGGVAIFLSFFVGLLAVKEVLVVGKLEYHHWLGFFIGGLAVVIGGILDDKYDLKPSRQVIGPIVAVLAVIAGGVGVTKISNPLNGLIYFDNWQLPLWQWGDTVYYFTVLADIFTVLWLMAVMYTTKLLDGVDGLVTGVAGIGGFIIFLFTSTTQYYQPDIATASLIFTACCAGFLIFNWNPAKIFLGESGSLLLGYILGVLAIISGGKVAIAVLILGIPILDLVWTVIRRIKQGQNPFKTSDKKHLHHRLLDLGLSQKKTALVFYGFAVLFGGSALFLQTEGKMIAIGLLLVVMFLVVASFHLWDKKFSK